MPENKYCSFLKLISLAMIVGAARAATQFLKWRTCKHLMIRISILRCSDPFMHTLIDSISESFLTETHATGTD
jgi:hypothetical protein